MERYWNRDWFGTKMEQKQVAEIPESFFQYRGDLAGPLFDAWTIPNKLITTIGPSLKKWGVGLGDISWNSQATSLGDLQVTFSVPKLGAAIRLGLETLTFDAANPDWSDAPNLIEMFDAVQAVLKQNADYEVAKQEVALAMHVRSGDQDLQGVMRQFVNVEKLGSAEMYGLSVYRNDSSWVIDKSLRYEKAYFIRLNRTFEPSLGFSEIAMSIYKDEVTVLGLLGLTELLPS